MSANNIPAGLKVPTQTPLDAKLHVASQAVLSDLGSNNNLAYTYYEGMIVYCVAEKTRWEWRQGTPGQIELKLLLNDFTYPNNLVVDGVTYSNKVFNFYKTSLAGPKGDKGDQGDPGQDATGLSGGGTFNYVAKWTPSGSELGNSQIRDNGSSVSVNSSLNPDARLSIVTSPTIPQMGIYSQTVTSGQNGVHGSNIGVGPGSNTGVYGNAQGGVDYNYGVSGSGESNNTATGIGVTGDAFGAGVSIGIRANAISGSLRYAAQLMDGTEGLGKVLTCTGSQGKANWATPATPVIPNLQRTITTFPLNVYTLQATDNNYTLILQNNSTAITINVPTGLPANFAVAFIQKGSADITISNSAVTILTPIASAFKIKGPNFFTYLEQEAASNTFYIGGNIKA